MAYFQPVQDRLYEFVINKPSVERCQAWMDGAVQQSEQATEQKPHEAFLAMIKRSAGLDTHGKSDWVT